MSGGCDHVEPLDPRMAGQCCKCGRRIPTDKPQGGAGRDLEYERIYLDQVTQALARKYGLAAGNFAERVKGRLALGEELYGDRWKGNDLIAELHEEALDLVAYALLDAQQMLASPAEPSSQRAMHLFEASVHAAAADAHARLARLPD